MYYVFYIDKSRVLTVSKTINDVYGEVYMVRVVELLKLNKLVSDVKIMKVNASELLAAEGSFIVQGTDCFAIKSINGAPMPVELNNKVLSILKNDIEIQQAE